MSSGPAISIEAAQALHQAGKFGEAEDIYARLLQENPTNADAWYLYGVLALQSGHAGKAAASLENASRLKPDSALSFMNLGMAYQRLGRWANAREVLARAAELDPNLPEVPNNLGVVLLSLGERAAAILAFRRAVALRPSYARAHYNLGTALRDEGANAEAATSFAEAARLEPGLVQAHANLGVVLHDLDDRAGAAAAYARALILNPDEPETLNNLGTLKRGDGEFMEAQALFEKAIIARPDFAEAHLNLGTAYQGQTRLDEAIAQYRRALALGAKKEAVHYNVGLATEFKGEFDLALEAYREALNANPDYFEARWNKALLHLLRGEFDEGWREYECRLSPLRKKRPKRPFHQPRWDGRRDLPGKLLIWGEQGLGDEVLYCRMAGELAMSGMGVVCELAPRLVPLAARSWPHLKAVGRSMPPDPATQDSTIVAQLPMGSLGQFLRPDSAALSRSSSAYLRADPTRRDAFANRLRAGSEGLIVGISWYSKNPDIGVHKSVALKDWGPILQTPGVRFVDLQYDQNGEMAAERGIAESALGVSIKHLPDVDLFNDIDGLAAVIAACDLVLTVSNTTAHLAGALGVPTWVLLPRGNGKLWYWGMRDTTTWYPSARLFRQQMPGEWNSVIVAVAEALRTTPRTALRRVP